jgi:hypothetical protein
LRTAIAVLMRVGASEDVIVLYGVAESPRSGPPPFGTDAAMREIGQRLWREFGDDNSFQHVDTGRAMANDDVIRLALDALASASPRVTTL